MGISQKAEDTKFYYIVGVRTKTTIEMEIKFNCDFVLGYTPEDIKKTTLARAMIDNKMVCTSAEEAIQAAGLSPLSSSLHALGLRVRANPEITVHKFVTDFPVEDEWFDMFIKMASVCKDTREKLIESKIW